MPEPRPEPSTPTPPSRPEGEERVFAAADGRLWGASVRREPDGGPGLIVLFTCMADARQAVRAVAVSSDWRLRDVTDELLRTWLATAPPVGNLT